MQMQPNLQHTVGEWRGGRRPSLAKMEFTSRRMRRFSEGLFDFINFR